MRDRPLLYARAKAMRHEPTKAEREMWRILRGGRMAGLKFRRQVPLGSYIADFACFDPKVIIECDAASTPTTPTTRRATPGFAHKASV